MAGRRSAGHTGHAGHTGCGTTRADLAIERYLAASDEYAAATTRASEQEAAVFLSVGLPGTSVGTNWAQLKSDETAAHLRAYRGRLRALAASCTYQGPVELMRLSPDGSWEPLLLPGDP